MSNTNDIKKMKWNQLLHNTLESEGGGGGGT